jgi:DNA polymerase-3 subunit delta
VKISGAAADRFARSPDPGVRAVLLHGPDRGLVRERGAAIAARWTPDPNDPFAVTTLTDSDIKGDPARIADEAAALSLTGGARLLRVRLDGDNAPVAAFIAALDAGQAAAEAKIIVETGELTPRAKLRVAFGDARLAAEIGCYADTPAALVSIAEGVLAEEGLALDRDAKALMAELLPSDRGFARAEIEKLILYKGPKGARATGDDTITPADLEASLSAGAESGVDDLTDAATTGNPAAADAALRRALDSGESPVGLIRAFARHLLRLQEARAKLDGGASIDAAMGGLRPPVFMMRKRAFGAALSRWSARALESALREALDVEVRLKGSGAPADAVLGRFVLTLARHGARG